VRPGGGIALALCASACGRIDFDAGDAGSVQLVRLDLWAAGEPYYPTSPDNIDLLLGEITPGATFAVGPHIVGGLTVVAVVAPEVGTFERVLFTANGETASEDMPPYSLGGEDGTDLRHAETIYVGPNTVRAEVRDANNATLAMTEVAFTLTIPITGGGQVTEARVIDNATGAPAFVLADAGVYAAGDFPAEADIELVTAPDVVGRVEVQGMTGAWPGQREDWPPYQIGGDEGTLTLAPGMYRVLATPYSFGGAGGDAGEPLDLTFTVQ
jgi:hypothetical protein